MEVNWVVLGEFLAVAVDEYLDHETGYSVLRAIEIHTRRLGKTPRKLTYSLVNPNRSVIGMNKESGFQPTKGYQSRPFRQSSFIRR